MGVERSDKHCKTYIFGSTYVFIFICTNPFVNNQSINSIEKKQQCSRTIRSRCTWKINRSSWSRRHGNQCCSCSQSYRLCFDTWPVRYSCPCSKHIRLYLSTITHSDSSSWTSSGQLTAAWQQKSCNRPTVEMPQIQRDEIHWPFWPFRLIFCLFCCSHVVLYKKNTAM